jgi:FkbM family methyltransferase
MKKFSIEEIDILKLDIEGAELEVLEDIIDEKIFPNRYWLNMT